MANATVTPTITYTDNDQKLAHVYGTIAISASPATYATGGLAVSFSGLTPPVPNVSNPASALISQSVAIWSNGGSGYVYGYNASTGKLQIFTGAAAQSALTELTDGGAIPAGVSGDAIVFNAAFVRG